MTPGNGTSTARHRRRRADAAAAGVAVSILIAGMALAALAPSTLAGPVVAVAGATAIVAGAAVGTHLRGGDVRSQLRWTALIITILAGGAGLARLLDNRAVGLVATAIALLGIPLVERRQARHARTTQG